MFQLNDDLSIYATRGDIVFFSVSAQDDGVPYHFQPGDVVRIKVFAKKNAEDVVLQKYFPVTENTENLEIFLNKEDTKIGEVISKPVDYWYEIELNPDTDPQTIIGYDEDGAKVFKLFPEGADIDEEYEPGEEDFPVVDEELDLTSPRPIANRVVAAEIERIRRDVEKYSRRHQTVTENTSISWKYPIVLADCTSGNITLQSPNANDQAVNGVEFTVKKIDATSNHVYVYTRPNSPDNEDISANLLLTEQNESITIFSNGERWYIKSWYKPSAMQ